MEISLSTGKAETHFRNDSTSNQVINGQLSAEAMRFDERRNCIWINSHDGLFKFTINDQQYHRIDDLKSFTDLKDYGRWVGIDLDVYGRVWFATQPKGILIYDPETDQVQQLFIDSVLLEQSGKYNLQLYCDPDGIAWASYWFQNELFQILPYHPPVKRYSANPNINGSLSNGAIYRIVPAANGKIWIGTKDGLNIFDPVTEKFEVLREKDLPGAQGKSDYTHAY